MEHPLLLMHRLLSQGFKHVGAIFQMLAPRHWKQVLILSHVSLQSHQVSKLAL